MQHPDNGSFDQSSSHIERVRIAAFDEQPFSDMELTHLATCEYCSAELEAMRALVSMAAAEREGSMSREMPRLLGWDAIAKGLQSDSASETPQRAAGKWLRFAATVLLFSGGALAGRISGGGLDSLIASGERPSTGAVLSSNHDTVTGNSHETAVAAVGAEFNSVDQATAALVRAQAEYEQAVVWLAANDSTDRGPDVYRNRLAALDQMMAASRAALRSSPADPVLNHYFLTAWAAREATLQALGNSLPVDKTIERY